jgi:hypothetical protein
MAREPNQQQPLRLAPEKVAYWYFRVNGFLQVENFGVRPIRRGGARTNADINLRFSGANVRLRETLAPGPLTEKVA